jgi:hypothetical protein
MGKTDRNCSTTVVIAAASSKHGMATATRAGPGGDSDSWEVVTGVVFSTQINDANGRPSVGFAAGSGDPRRTVSGGVGRPAPNSQETCAEQSVLTEHPTYW